MSYYENRLALSCKQLGEASVELLEWIDDNADVVGAERISLLREFYRTGQNAHRLAAAVNTMSCVAVVGPRRSGKTQLVSSLIERISPSPVAGLREDDVWELRDYFARRFVDEPVLGVLAAAGFWEFMAENCTRLGNAERVRLLSLVWGGLEAFTRLFAVLSDALSRLGFGREASSALVSILGLDQRTGRFVRRADSILSAQTVTGLDETCLEMIVVRTELGQWVSQSRPILSALATEVRLPVRGYASELLEKADIVEMPAIEPRETVPQLRSALEQDMALAPQLFMKAKAVLLLERYTADNEITSLVLCVDPSTRRLGELPRLVGDWVERTHGADPTEREPNDNGLFVDFTKLDRELADHAGRAHRSYCDATVDLARIAEAEAASEERFFADWSQAFSMLVAESAVALREGDLNAEQNRRLGQLLMLLDTTI